jgi:hypothetical protein
VKLSLIILGLISLIGFRCSKNTPASTVFTGRLIVNGPCEHYAIQLLKGHIDTANIESSWYDSDNDSTYTNAFAVSNYCTFGVNGLQLGDVFTFQIDPHPKAQTCPICAIAVAVPSKYNAVINVQKAK